MLSNTSDQLITPKESSPRQQLIATCAAFFILGAAFSTWASRIPAIQDISLLTPVTLGYVLLAKGVGMVIIMPAVTAAIHAFGARLSAGLFGLLVILSLIPMTLAPDWITLLIILFVAGMGVSGYNICINALGSKIEANTGKSHMSMIHSWFGVGNFAGALIGTGLASMQFTASSHFWGMAGLLLIILILIFRYLPEGEPATKERRKIFEWPRGGMIWLALICFLAASIEESVSNWVALFFTDHVGTSDGTAPVGYAAYAGSLLIMRLVGDRLKPRFGAKSLLIAGSFLAAFGIMLAIFSPSVVLAVVGFIATGAGVALTFPMVFSAAGRQGAVMLATVATVGYLGAMISQPVMGYLVNEFELAGGFLFVIACSIGVAFCAWKAKLLNK